MESKPTSTFPPQQEIFLYRPSPELDLLVASWWARLYTEAELVEVAGSPVVPLSRFLAMMQLPTQLVIGVDKAGIWFAAWYEPFMNGAYISVYCAPEWRRTRMLISAYEWALDCGLHTYGTIMSLTRQDRLLPIMRALGYNFVGRIPGIFAGMDAHIAMVTRQSFDARSLQYEPAGVISCYKDG